MTRNMLFLTLAFSCGLASCTTVQKPDDAPAPKAVVQVIYPYKYKGEKCFTRFIEDVPADEVCVKKDIVSYNPAPVAYYSHAEDFPDYVRALFAAAKVEQVLADRKEGPPMPENMKADTSTPAATTQHTL
ncbi:hypothetical protein MUU53_09905 [Rhizobium lemnae]|uniref:Lipoprotein n=1 Tax=Rhizobium lemnae TaxID=1214924 RepID=A0ABV8E601_9HYPH|nr:hypothetical protein [Rhizobium lemnae]MCJ8508225.1 hypothetical protein [Rhizobium lemnae]